MNARETVSLLLLVMFAFGGCEKKKKEQIPETQATGIVRVGDIILTGEDLENILPESERIPFTIEEKKVVVDRWVDQEIIYQEAVRRGYKNDPRIRARLRSLEQEFLADHLVYIELRNRTRVSEEEIEKYFNEHKREYLYEYRVSHIMVNTLEEAENVEELLGKRSFIWVANRYSVDPVARNGGDLGYLTKGNMIPEFENAIFDLKSGGTSDIIKSDFGYHIIKLIGMRESLNRVGLEDVREQIMNALMIEKRENSYREFLESLRSSADVEYIDNAYGPGPAQEAKTDSLELEEFK
ncbi:MAG: peptidylprolyl isomerase [Candidatus Krumholzibacteria bacterium]|nr:peptidylprolyl isomerase [Candidatus Krumholzibacteria bacterium]